VRGKTSPVPRVEAAAGDVNGKLYLLGGYMGTWTPNPRCDAYDVATQTWTRLADMPEPLTHGASEVVGTDIYIAGGYVAKSSGVGQIFGTTHVWKYDTFTTSGRALRRLTAGARAAAMVAIGRELHVFGGEPAARIESAAIGR
jgi:N-acetylneuraminic acid mutarotase